MKIVFLDIDGVLNSEQFMLSEVYRKLHHPFQLFDPRAVSLVNRFTKFTKAQYVITSSHRLHYTLEEMQMLFAKVGFEIPIVGLTPPLKTLGKHITRGNEIKAWIQENEASLGKDYKAFQSYVILDDREDFLLQQAPHYFSVDPYVGITPTLLNKAKDFLLASE